MVRRGEHHLFGVEEVQDARGVAAQRPRLVDADVLGHEVRLQNAPAEARFSLLAARHQSPNSPDRRVGVDHGSQQALRVLLRVV